MDFEKDHDFMALALEEAQAADLRGEVPIGAVILHSSTGEIVSKAGNRTRELNDPTAHAEILAIRLACAKLGAQRIPECDLYVTLEPCPMCAPAISYARIKRLIFGASDPKSGGVLSGPRCYDHAQIHHKPEITSGIMSPECGLILTGFFAARRLSRRNGQDF